MSSSSRFKLIDAVVLGVVIVALVALLLLWLPSGRRMIHHVDRNPQLRGIHQSMVMYAQSNGNWFPGFDSTGNVVDATVEYRYQVLLDGNYFTGEYMMSPNEVKTEWTTGPVTSANYSFAMLDIDAPGERAKEWRETLNPEAALLSDRNTGSDTQTHVQSIHTDKPGDWRGTIAWGDNHTAFSTAHLINTKYGEGPSLVGDNLFETSGGAGDDAYMIYSGD